MNTQSKTPTPVSIDKEVLEITKGEWTIEPTGGILTPFVINSHRIQIASLQWGTKSTVPETIEEVEANAKAICKAVNGTYGKGLNPDTMADLLKACDLLLVAETWEQITFAKQFAAKSIQKATL